jgi:hypothetical protein
MDENLRRAEELLRLAGQGTLVKDSKDPNSKLIDDFVLGTGAFSDTDIMVDPQDLSRLRFYRTASREILARAEDKDSDAERERLLGIARSHMARIARILDRYEV